MQKIVSVVAAGVVSLLAMSAHAVQAVDDSELSAVTAQDGVTLGGDLNINIGAFTWTDTDVDGGSVAFNNISIKGMFVQTIDILDAYTIVELTNDTMKQYVGSKSRSESVKLLGGTYDAFGARTGAEIYDFVSDVVQFAFPNAKLDHRLSPTIKIASITNGNSTKSYGSLEIRNLDMQGTKIWLWAH